MTSSNGNIFRIAGKILRGHPWIPLTKASDTELWRFRWSASEQMINNWDADDLRRHRAHHCNDYDVWEVVIFGMRMMNLVASTWRNQ